ncbi:Signal transduction histidine kinase [Janthinobacterium sp. ROICE36]|uniref:Signal transduction histidine kinase n=1 Tax=Janthinobacterium sp. ROICE36 TaxID=2048670 RepID=UPI000C7F5F43|nr:Signal transduction histidine kinase [Janthinobacterium sp. ROICE36]PLY39788.1 Signal transduction histidine kinase [Janthinobacterium sp. ROICE36]
MNIRTLLFLLLLGLIALFAAVNWSLFVAPTALSLIVMTVHAPLGLVMLAIVALLGLAALVVAGHLKTAMLIENHRHAKEMHGLRHIADEAESSRLTALRQFLETELDRQAHFGKTLETTLLLRLGEVEQSLRTTVEQTGNTLAAYLGEIDDRLEKSRLGTPD